MGEPMAQRLLDAGYPLTVYNRTIEKTRNLRQNGAVAASTPQEAVEQTDVSIIMLADYPAIENIFFKDPMSRDTWKNKTLIMMSTITPDESLKIKEHIIQRGGEYLEAPVLGSIPAVQAGTLLIFTGGTHTQSQKWDHLLSEFSTDRFYMGETGKATAVKLAINQLAIAQTTAFSMSLGYVREAGVDVNTFMEIIKKSAYHSPGLERKAGTLMKRDYSTIRFPLKLMLKDLDLMIHQFSAAGIDTSALKGTRKVLQKGIDDGNGDRDSLTVYETIHPV